MLQCDTRQAALKNAKRDVIVAGARLYRAKIKHLKAQDIAHQIKRKQMTQFVSYCEHASSPDVALNAEQIVYNRNLLQRYYGTEDNFARQRMYLRFELREMYLSCLHDSKRQLQTFNQEAFILENLQPSHFFMNVVEFNQNNEAAYSEDNLHAEQESFAHAIEQMNTLNQHYARWLTYAAEMNADGYCLLLIFQAHALLQWSCGNERMFLPLTLFIGIQCIQLSLHIAYGRNQERIQHYMHQSIPTVFSNTELKTLFSTRGQPTESMLVINPESPRLR